MKTHISELRTFMRKDTYQVLADTAIKPIPSVHRAFPIARTNIIEVDEPALTAIIKLIHLLADESKQVGYLIDKLDRNLYGFSAEDTARYFTDLHNSNVKKIRGYINNHNPNDYIGYERWFNPATKEYVVLFIDPNGDEDTMQSLLDFASQLDDDADAYSTSQQQQLFNQIINMVAKLDLIKQLNLSTAALLDGHVNLNNDIAFLVKTTKGSDNDGDGSYLIYHALIADIWVSSYNELITTLTYKRYRSIKANADTTRIGEIDVFIPNALPARYKGFERNAMGGDSKLISISAGDGKQEISHLDLSSLGESGLFYKDLFADLVTGICIAAGVAHTPIIFDPELRARPWVRMAAVDPNTPKSKLTIIVGIPHILRDKVDQVVIKYNDPSQKGTKATPRNTANDRMFTLDYMVSDTIDAYLTYLKENAFTDYDVSVVDITDIKYDDLEDDVDYIFLQEPKPEHGYWRITTAGKLKELTDEYGDSWQEHLHLGFFHPAIKLDRNHDFIDSYRKRQSSLSKDDNAVFYTDTYTMWKIYQLEAAIAGKPKKSLQGLHMPHFKRVASQIIGYKRFRQDQPELDHLSHKVRKDFEASRLVVYDKINIDIGLKNALVTKGVLNLYNELGDLADYSAYIGEYRCYYVIRPKSLRTNGFYASQIDFTVSADGISIESVKVLDNTTSIRAAGKFGISTSAVSNFYNNSFYLVNEAGDVLTFYSNRREAQPLACIPQFGAYKDWKLTQFYYYKLADQPYGNPTAVPISKRIKPIKYPKPNNHKELSESELEAAATAWYSTLSDEDKNQHDESLFNGFYTIPTQGIQNIHHAHLSNHPDANGKYKSAGGKEWMFFKELESGGLLIYLTNKQDVHGALSTPNRVYKMLVKDKNGSVLNAATSKLAMLYIETASYHIARVNNFSSKSLLESLAKIALKD